MYWIGLLVLGVMIAGGATFVIVAAKGSRAIKTDGWSPAEAVIGRKIWSRKQDDNAE